jgi:hypothetical protein
MGGWDGHRDLGDFWRYDVSRSEWNCLSEDTRKEGGPGPRSCHKIVLHPTLRRLYVFGRYVDTETRASAPSTALQAELHYYDLEKHTWTLACSDVEASGGPGLIYDHQMAIDEIGRILYVFGGRIINAHQPISGAETLYSGLYSYDLEFATWKLIRADGDVLPGTPNIKARIGHSMIFNPLTRQLIIYAGQRHKDYLCDFYIYDVDRNVITQMIKDTSKIGGPEAGFTQRSTLDATRQELFLFSGLMRERSASSGLSGLSGSAGSAGSIANNPATGSNIGSNTGNNGQQTMSTEAAKNSFWIYNLNHRKWTRIYSSDSSSTTSDTLDEPCPRFAHQLVYDPVTKTHYLFGGNPGESGNPRRRLGDFWALKLDGPLSGIDILRRAIFRIRRQQFFEMCLTRRRDSTMASPSMVDAMRFLQTEVALTVDHDDAEESRQFRTLSSWLLSTPNEGAHEARLKLFSSLVELLPLSMQPPSMRISDLL